jgi:hypothetical protein
MTPINQQQSQIFSWSRFKALLMQYIYENGKTLGLYSISLIGLTILVGGAIGYNIGDETVQVTTMIFFASTIYSCGLVISASLMFISLKNKTGRISTFMTPASLLEKYLVRLVIYLFVFLIVVTISILIGEFARHLFSTGSYKSIISTPLNQLISLNSVLYAVGSSLSGYAVYSLGSSLWPRNSFFKTFAVTLVLIVILMSACLPSLLPTFSRMEESEHTAVYISWGTTVFDFALAIVCFGLSWYRFKTTQIVQRFMTD